MCTTLADGADGGCVSFVGPYDVCDSADEVRVVNSELGTPQMECSSSKVMMEDGDKKGFVCKAANCRVASNETVCMRDELPTKFEMKETVCEKCVEGRVKLRPVVETRNVCRNKSEEFCLDVIDREVKWRKWCRPLPGGAGLNPTAGSPPDTPRFGSNRRPRPVAKLDEETLRELGMDDVSEETTTEEPEPAQYHIEVSPGRWISTADEEEAHRLLEEQRQKEDDFSSRENEVETSTEASLSSTTTTTSLTTSNPPQSKEQLQRKAFRSRITTCLFKPRECRFK